MTDDEDGGGSGKTGEGTRAVAFLFWEARVLLPAMVMEGKKARKKGDRGFAALLCETKGELNLKHLPDLARGVNFTDQRTDDD